jgi:hypothetical protein
MIPIPLDQIRQARERTARMAIRTARVGRVDCSETHHWVAAEMN